MKSKDQSLVRGNSLPSLYQPPRSFGTETAFFGMLGVVSVAAIGIALTWGSAPSDSQNSSLATYFRSGQATADLRTASAAVEYLMEPDLPNPTNFVDRSQTQRNLAMPTNTAAIKPKA
jgi:hypothetical protein